jgi:hypothetical protein
MWEIHTMLRVMRIEKEKDRMPGIGDSWGELGGGTTT